MLSKTANTNFFISDYEAAVLKTSFAVQEEAMNMEMSFFFQELIAELKLSFPDALTQQTIKEDLMITLRERFRFYPELKDTIFQDSTVDYIRREAMERYALPLNAKELNELWHLPR